MLHPSLISPFTTNVARLKTDNSLYICVEPNIWFRHKPLESIVVKEAKVNQGWKDHFCQLVQGVNTLSLIWGFFLSLALVLSCIFCPSLVLRKQHFKVSKLFYSHSLFLSLCTSSTGESHKALMHTSKQERTLKRINASTRETFINQKITSDRTDQIR